MISLQLEKKKKMIGKAYKMKRVVLKDESTALIQIAFASEMAGWGGVFCTTGISKETRPPAFHTCFLLIHTTFTFRSSRSSCRTLICEHAQGGKRWETFGGLKCYKGTTHINNMIL